MYTYTYTYIPDTSSWMADVKGTIEHFKSWEKKMKVHTHTHTHAHTHTHTHRERERERETSTSKRAKTRREIFLNIFSTVAVYSV